MTHLHQIDIIKKLEKWIPHALSEQQQATRVEACTLIINQHGDERVLETVPLLVT